MVDERKTRCMRSLLSICNLSRYISTAYIHIIYPTVQILIFSHNVRSIMYVFMFIFFKSQRIQGQGTSVITNYAP